jgi:hypothetical protein
MLDKAKALKALADLRAMVGSMTADGDTMLAAGSLMAALESAINAA